MFDTFTPLEPTTASRNRGWHASYRDLGTFFLNSRDLRWTLHYRTALPL